MEEVEVGNSCEVITIFKEVINAAWNWVIAVGMADSKATRKV